MARLEAHARAVDLGTGATELLAILGLVDVDADLGEQLIGLALDQVEAIGRQQVVGHHLATDEGRPIDDRMRPLPDASVPSSPSTSHGEILAPFEPGDVNRPLTGFAVSGSDPRRAHYDSPTAEFGSGKGGCDVEQRRRGLRVDGNLGRSRRHRQPRTPGE